MLPDIKPWSGGVTLDEETTDRFDRGLCMYADEAIGGGGPANIGFLLLPGGDPNLSALLSRKLGESWRVSGARAGRPKLDREGTSLRNASSGRGSRTSKSYSVEERSEVL